MQAPIPSDTLHGKPQELAALKTPQQLRRDLGRARALLWLAGIAAFLASSVFVVSYFVGGELSPSTWNGEQWLNATLGLLLTLAITSGQALLYVSGYQGIAAVLATAVVVFFGFFSEVSQSMEREDVTVRQRSAQSPVFQAALQNIQQLSQPQSAPSYAQQQLANAQGELQRWQAEQAAKERCHTCSKYSTRTIGTKLAAAQGQVAAAEQQFALAQQQQLQTLQATIQQAKALEYDEGQHYGMIRLLQQAFNLSGIYAAFLFSVIIIGTFEYIFHFAGSYVANHRKALQLLGLNEANPDSSNETSKPNPAPLPNMLPAQHFARDWLRLSHSKQFPSQPQTGFIPPAATSDNTVKTSATKRTGKVSQPLQSVPEPAYRRLCTLVQTGQLKPSQPALKKALREQGIGSSQMQRQTLASQLLARMYQEGILQRNPAYSGSGCGRCEYLLAN